MTSSVRAMLAGGARLLHSGAMAAADVVAVGRSAWRTIDVVGRAATVAIFTACATAVVVWLPVTLRALGIAAALAPLCWAALVDLAERRLPNVLVAAGLAAVAATVAVATANDGIDDGRQLAVSVLVGAAAMSLPMLAMHLVSPAGMGFGDVKAGVALGATVGLIDAWSAVLALMAGSLLGAVLGLTLRRRHIPFGPALVAGTAVALVAARMIGVSPAG